MIDAPNIADELAQSGYTDYVGVPCSHLSPLIATAQSAPRLSYIAAANEGDAIAIGLGAHLGGRKTVILSQNSGLGNMVNPLTSLLRPFQVPMLLMITWRGEPGVPDEPQHEQMGSITPDLLNLLDVSWEFLPNTPCEALKAIRRGCEYVDHEQRVFAFVIRPNTLSGHITLRPSRDCRAPAVNRTWTGTSSERPTRIDAMQELLSQERGDEVYIATTGYTGRELFSLNDRANNLYVVGGMGTAASIGFGLANARRCQPVVVLDGDGSLLMRMGSLAPIGQHGPKNLLHVVFDNECYASTGGQSSSSSVVRFDQCAEAMNYRRVIYVDGKSHMAQAIQEAKIHEGPVLIHLKVDSAVPPKLPRPTRKPFEVKERLIRFLNQSQANQDLLEHKDGADKPN